MLPNPKAFRSLVIFITEQNEKKSEKVFQLRAIEFIISHAFNCCPKREEYKTCWPTMNASDGMSTNP
jgi:hypothetical protein